MLDIYVVVGVSGGSDSTALFHIMRQLFVVSSQNNENHHDDENTLTEFRNTISRNAFDVSLLLYIHDILTNHPSIYNDVWLHCSDATNLQCVSTWGEESFDLTLQ